jgi:hypothetical protein
MFATSARAGEKITERTSNEFSEHIGIPEIWGLYNQKKVSDALIKAGKQTPLLAQWQSEQTILWQMYGKLGTEGFYLQPEIGFGNGFSLGGSLSVMHVSSVQSFTLPAMTIRDMNLLSTQIIELDNERRAMNDLLGLTGAQWTKTGFTDTEVHMRYGLLKDYVAKFRKIDAGVFAGVIIPTGVLRDVNNPASVPFGSDGHAGIFFGVESLFELKEDWTFGVRLQVQGYSTNTQIVRMPVNNETILFGAVVGPARVYPGATVVFCPSFKMADLRDGLGAQAQYTLAYHGGDVWTDLRSDKTVPTTLNAIHDLTQWAAEYMSISVFYDPNRDTRDEKIYPLVNFCWDFPVKALVAEKVSKTNRISVGISYHF